MATISRISAQTRLGFIGLGYLGSRIASRLAKAGFPMIVYDRDPAKAAQISARDPDLAQSVADLTRSADVVLSCLPDGAAVETAYIGANGVLESARRGTIVIEMSTISPENSLSLHDVAYEAEISVLDVAVSGSTQAAESGKLTLFGGGNREQFEAAEPIFEAIATQWFYMGSSGRGVAMKLVVNTLLGIGMQAIAESLALGTGLGLSRDLLLDTLARTTVVAPAHLGKLASAKRNDYSPQFPVRLMRKDFRLILAEAASLELAMPAAEAAATINALEATRGVEEDFSAVIRQMEEQAGTRRRVTPAQTSETAARGI